MNECNKEDLKQELMSIIKDWCKRCNRTHEEAFQMLKEMYNNIKKDKTKN